MPVRNGEKYVLRALHSIPKTNEIETIVIDDCSEDSTYSLVKTYIKYADRNIRLYKNSKRGYPCTCINNGIELAHGDYIGQLDSDDYLLTDNFLRLLLMDRKEDIIFYHNEINDGTIWKPENQSGLCDHICWYKRSFIGDVRQGYQKWGAGLNFHKKLMGKNPTIYYHKEVVYHYNFPREGSTYDLGKKGLL